MENALVELKKELFDAPDDVKENFNTIIQYFSSIDESRIAKILNKKLRADDPEVMYTKLLAQGTQKELLLWLRDLLSTDRDLVERLRNYYSEDLDDIMDRLIKEVQKLQSNKKYYVLLHKSFDYEEGRYFYKIHFLDSNDIKSINNKIKVVEKSSKISGNFSSDLKKLMAKYSKKVTSENAGEMMEILGAAIANISDKSKSRRGISVGSALKHACQYSNAEDAYWDELSD